MPVPSSASPIHLFVARPPRRVALALAALALLPLGCRKKEAPPAAPAAAKAEPQRRPLKLVEGSPEQQRAAIAQAIDDAELTRFAKLEAMSVAVMRRQTELEANPDATRRSEMIREVESTRDALATNTGYQAGVARVMTEVVRPWYVNALRLGQLRHQLDRVQNGEVDPSSKLPPPTLVERQARGRDLSLTIEKILSEQHQAEVAYGKPFVTLLENRRAEFFGIYLEAFEELRRK